MKKWLIGAGIIIIVLIAWGVWDAQQPGELDAFAQCLTERDITYYGAFWCPNCQNQNKMFGRSKDHLNYVECSTPDGNRQTQQCIDAGITAYPTWEFPGGERTEGTLELAEIAERSGCELPENY